MNFILINKNLTFLVIIKHGIENIMVYPKYGNNADYLFHIIECKINLFRY